MTRHAGARWIAPGTAPNPARAVAEERDQEEGSLIPYRRLGAQQPWRRVQEAREDGEGAAGLRGGAQDRPRVRAGEEEPRGAPLPAIDLRRLMAASLRGFPHLVSAT